MTIFCVVCHDDDVPDVVMPPGVLYYSAKLKPDNDLADKDFWEARALEIETAFQRAFEKRKQRTAEDYYDKV